MKRSAIRLIVLCGLIIVLIAVSGGIYVNAQTGVDQGPVGENSGTTDDQPVATSGNQTVAALENNCSALDPNAASGEAGALPTNDVDITAPRPDAIPPGWAMNFIRFDGAAFKPRNSTYTYAESGSGGCIYATANPTGVWNVDLQLPSDAIVDIVRLFWYDTSASASYLWLSQYNDQGSLVDIGYVPSAGNTGYGNDAFFPAEYVVDNYTYSLLLNWRPYVADSTMMICGVRVRYWTPAPAICLPMINK